MNPELVERIRSVRFTPVRLREGYVMADVDEFCDQLEVAISAGRAVGPMVEAARFNPVRMREGYDMGDVDDFLDEIVRLSSVASSPTADGPSSPVAAKSVIEETPGLLSRLFRRK